MSVNNSNVAHSFVYGNHAKDSNFSSSASGLYSYDSLLAVHYEGLILVDDHIADYSISSSKHMSHLRNAVYDRLKLIYVYHESIYYLDRFNMTNELSCVLSMVKELLLKQSKARVTDYFPQIEHHIHGLTELIGVFGVDKRTNEYKEYLTYLDLDTLKEEYKERITNYAALQAKKKKAEQKKAYKRKLKKLESFTGVIMKAYSIAEINTYDFLVIRDNDTLCTSQNLCVPLKDARLLYLMLVRGKNIIGHKISYHTILNHNEKYVTIGCHKILIKELERVLS